MEKIEGKHLTICVTRGDVCADTHCTWSSVPVEAN